MYNNESQSDDPKEQGQPPPYTDGAPSGMTNNPQIVYAQPAMQTVVMGQPTGVVYQGNMNMMPMGIPMAAGPPIGPKASPLTCPSCNQQIVTKVEYKSSMRTHFFAIMFCMLGCLPCIFIPYCVDSCRNADHYCPECNAFLGSYMRV